MKVYFVRHGESEANLGKFYAGQSDAKLTETGLQQAKAIRPILEGIPFDKVYSSDLSRAAMTQKTALPGYEVEYTAQLREVDVGDLAGKTFAQVKEMLGGVSPTGDYTPFGGESRAMLDIRVRDFMKMLEKQPYENVAVFAHWGVLLSTMRLLVGTNFPSDVFFCANCAINVLEFDGKVWRILALNYMKEI